MFIENKWAQQIQVFVEKVKKFFMNDGKSIELSDDANSCIRMTFAGQYSAGKSSIIKMLTGRSDISVGAGITTQKVLRYDWDGIEVIDTPGIHTKLRPDHDAVSYQAIVSADLLVYVITNELFDAYIAEQFRKLAIEADRASEMVLVVNKMDRTANGNSREQQMVIRDDLRKVLAPYTPEQFNLVFLDAESYLDGKDENDPELAKEYIDRSGYYEFIDTLNRFINAKGITAKLTTKLYEIDKLLEDEIEKIQPKSNDERDELEEYCLQQLHALTEVRGLLADDIMNIYSNAASQIRAIGAESANLLEIGSNPEDVEDTLYQNIQKVTILIEKSHNDVKKAIEIHLSRLNVRLDQIDHSDFANKLKSDLSVNFDSLSENIRDVLNKLSKTSSAFKFIGEQILKNAYKSGATSGFRLFDFSGGNIHKAVKTVGHFFNHSFKPYEALKISKGIAIGGKVLNAFGIGLEIFAQFKSEYDEAKICKEIYKYKQNIRSQFNSCASEISDYGNHCVQKYVYSPLDDAIAQINCIINQIRESCVNNTQKCCTMRALREECGQLIKAIHCDMQ